jgi:CheY-like chemotaxis protein
MKILLAEDDPSIQIVAKLSLQRIGGHEVHIVENGQAAIDRASAEKFDLIILDCMMPVMGGFDACRELKLRDETKEIPIIFMTAKNQKTETDEIYKLGAVGLISKPFDARELCTDIEKIMSKSLWKAA